ncbi:MAG: putative MFS-type transporter [Burkholderiaceae bacterium]|jgi:MFS family permease|nr:MAG: putative MFS-type transporter [Burkholderiaceae bacterium]
MQAFGDERRAAAKSSSVLVVASAGAAALAVAMGIGRFAFTPLLPMMQADAGLTLAAAGWLAAANYLGYLIGALCAVRVPARWALRGGLLLIALTTAGMGATNAFAAWAVLRLLAGVASAWVLVHVSAWALDRLTALHRPQANGTVFAGVGLGIAGAGMLCLWLMHGQIDSARAWEWFGLVSLLLTAAVWAAFGSAGHSAASEAAPAPSRVQWNADKLLLALCYGAFGIGYIIPATFLSAMAKHYITDPAVFGWAWPAFGAAAALSTWASARWLHAADNRRLWAGAHVLMALGVALPALWQTLSAILIAALLVGGTFMVVVMAGLREARVVATGDATGYIAAITAVFAVGQVIGPLIVSAFAQLHDGFAIALLTAAAVLALAAVALWRSAK